MPLPRLSVYFVFLMIILGVSCQKQAIPELTNNKDYFPLARAINGIIKPIASTNMAIKDLFIQVWIACTS